MKLLTVKEHDERVLHMHNNMRAGIECSNCGNEMQYVDTTIMLSAPGQRNIKCFECNKVDRIYV